jgi:hypothetical protein
LEKASSNDRRAFHPIWKKTALRKDTIENAPQSAKISACVNRDRSALGGPSDSFHLAQMPVGVEKLALRPKQPKFGG